MKLTAIPHTPVPQRPAMPGSLTGAADHASQLSRQVIEVWQTLSTSARGGQDAPDTTAVTGALKQLTMLDQSAARVLRDAEAAAGAGGTHRLYVQDRSKPNSVVDHARTVTSGLADATEGLRQLLSGSDPVATWARTHSQLVNTHYAARSMVNEYEQLHRNQFATHVDGFGSGLAAFDRDGDGYASLAPGADRETTQSPYGVAIDHSKLLEAADRAGNADGRVSSQELMRLASPFDADRDSWLSNRDAERLNAKYPTTMPPPTAS